MRPEISNEQLCNVVKAWVDSSEEGEWSVMSGGRLLYRGLLCRYREGTFTLSAPLHSLKTLRFLLKDRPRLENIPYKTCRIIGARWDIDCRGAYADPWLRTGLTAKDRADQIKAYDFAAEALEALRGDTDMNEDKNLPTTTSDTSTSKVLALKTKDLATDAAKRVAFKRLTDLLVKRLGAVAVKAGMPEPLVTNDHFQRASLVLAAFAGMYAVETVKTIPNRDLISEFAEDLLVRQMEGLIDPMWDEISKMVSTAFEGLEKS